MKSRKVIALLCLLLCGLSAVSCVHEFPGLFPNRMRITLKFDTPLPFYKEHIYYTRAADDDGPYRVRYIVKGYTLYDDGTSAPEPSFSETWYGNDINSLDTEVTFDIPSGKWRLTAWSDIVGVGQTQLYYNADAFNAITYTSPYVGNTDLRDAYRGEGEILAEPENYAGNDYDLTIWMRRPLAKFIFVSTDWDEFVKHYVRSVNASGSHITEEDVHPSDFKVIFYYPVYMPNTYNLLTDRPVDSASGVSFEGKLTMLEDGRVSLGFDYTMVRTAESSVRVAVGVYDSGGKQLSMSQGIEVPLMRGKYTLVTGKFLVSGSSSGIAINPDFDGEFNIIIGD